MDGDSDNQGQKGKKRDDGDGLKSKGSNPNASNEGSESHCWACEGTEAEVASLRKKTSKSK